MFGLDLSALEIFQCVAQEGSISKAAIRLSRVQSNISTRVKQLEEKLGVTLFLRTRRGLALTDAGRTLLGYADRLISLSREAAEALNDGRPTGQFRIGSMESTAATRLPSVLATYHAAFPQVTIHLHTDVAAGLLDRLARGDVDIAFLAEPVTAEAFETRPVFTEELVLIGPGTAAAAYRPADLNKMPLIAFEEGCAYRRYLHEWLLEERVTPGRTMAVGSYLAMLACVSAGAGYAVAPRSVLDTVAGKAGKREFRTYRLPKKYRRIRTLLVWRKGYASSKLAALNEVLKS